MFYKEEGRTVGMPVKVNVTDAVQMVNINGDVMLRNTGTNECYFLLDQGTPVTSNNGYRIAAGELFPVVLAGRKIQVVCVSTKTTTLEVVTL